MRWTVVLVAACRVGPEVAEIRCQPETVVLAPDEVSDLGFSAADAVAWYGDAETLEATWTGRHSREPPSDTFDVSLGEITGEVTLARHAPVAPDATEVECASDDVVEFARAATVASRDGEVSGAGELRFVLRALALDDGRTEVSLTTPDLSLTEARWIEVDAAVPDDLPPPGDVALYAYHGSFEAVEIVADGDSYSVSVWKCDEQHHAGCADWSSFP